MAGYILSNAAETDLAEIIDYVAEDSIQAALSVYEKFLAVFRMLADHPNAGHHRDDLASRAVRFFPVYSYMVVYVAGSRPLEIARLLNAAQDMKSLLK